MAALPLGVHTCESPSGPTKLWFEFNGQVCRALVVKAVDTGLMLAIPKNGIPHMVFEEAEELGYVGSIGPFTELSVYAVGTNGKPTKRLLDVVLFDLDAGGAIMLSQTRPGGVDPETIPAFGFYQRREEWPVPGHLVAAASNFVQTGGNRLDAYFTAAKEGELPGVDNGEPAPSVHEVPNGEGADPVTQQLLSQSEVTQRLVMA